MIFMFEQKLKKVLRNTKFHNEFLMNVCGLCVGIMFTKISPNIINIIILIKLESD